MIVAPITKAGDKKGMATKSVWLPCGRWTDIFTGDEYEGGRWVEMVRWRDSIPVLVGEGGFFLLDGRTHSNSVSNPDRLTVMVFNGNGQYTLHEDREASFMHTHFVSAAEGGKQTLRVFADGDTSVVPVREYRFEFRNIPDGEVKVFAGGKEIPFRTETDDHLAVILQGVSSVEEYVIEITYHKGEYSARNAGFLYSLRRIEGNYGLKGQWYRALRHGDNEECRKFIENEVTLGRTEKKRLLESL